MAKYTREEALEAAARLTSLYGVYTTVCDCESYSFVGVHLTKDNICVCAIDEEADIKALRALAYIIAQTDQDLAGEHDPVEKIKDTPGGVREMMGSPEEHAGKYEVVTGTYNV